MKKFGFLALLGAFATAANAQFLNADLVVGIQSTSVTTTDASVFQMDKISGAAGFTVATTGFRFSSSSVGGGIKGDIDGSIYLAGATSALSTAGRVGKVTMAGGFSQAVTTSAARGVAATGTGTFFATQATGAGLSSGTLTFDNLTAAGLVAINTVTTRMVASNNGVGYYTRASTTAASNGVFDSTGAQVATTSVVAATGLIDLAISWDGLTMYAADERTDSSGGIVKYTRAVNSGAFTQQYILSTATGTATTGARYLAVEYDAGGVATIYAATVEASNNRLVKIVDTGVGSLGTSIATAGTGNAYKGVGLVPEPASFAVIGLGLLGLVARRRRNK